MSIGLVIAFLVWSCLSSPQVITGPVGGNGDLPTTVYVQKGNLYAGMFGREPVEVVVFIYKVGTFFRFTTMHEDRVACSLGEILLCMASCGKDVKDVVICVHNHLNISGFSLYDVNTYRYLVKEGFKGKFLIYYPHNGMTIEYDGTKTRDMKKNYTGR